MPRYTKIMICEGEEIRYEYQADTVEEVARLFALIDNGYIPIVKEGEPPLPGEYRGEDLIDPNGPLPQEFVNKMRNAFVESVFSPRPGGEIHIKPKHHPDEVREPKHQDRPIVMGSGEVSGPYVQTSNPQEFPTPQETVTDLEPQPYDDSGSD